MIHPYRSSFKSNPAPKRWDGLFRLHDIEECERRIAEIIFDHEVACMQMRSLGGVAASWAKTDWARVRREVYGSYDGGSK